jgi:hypothetical protein
MGQVNRIGWSEIYTRLLDTPVTLAILADITKVSDVYHSDIVQCDEVYNKFGFDYAAPHRGMYRAYIHMHIDTLSLAAWEEAHMQACDTANWHAAYLYTVTTRIADIQELTVYKLKPTMPDEATYITFSPVHTPELATYKRVNFHSQAVHAEPYEFRDNDFELLDAPPADEPLDDLPEFDEFLSTLGDPPPDGEPF